MVHKRKRPRSKSRIKKKRPSRQTERRQMKLRKAKRQSLMLKKSPNPGTIPPAHLLISQKTRFARCAGRNTKKRRPLIVMSRKRQTCLKRKKGYKEGARWG